MSTERDPEHVVHFALEPLGAGPQRHDRVHRELPAGIELDLHPQVHAPLQRSQEVNDLERALAVAVLDRRHVHQVVVPLARRVAQPLHHFPQLLGADADEGLAVARHGGAADGGAEGRSQGVDGGVHADRNW